MDTESRMYPFRRPGQRCGTCLHIRPTGDERRWHRFVCAAHIASSGDPAGLPVEVEAGTHCAYFRARGSSGGTGGGGE